MLSGFTNGVIATFQNASVFMKMLTTGAVSLIPVIELRGGIPVGTALGLNIWQSFISAVIGNMIPIPFILLFLTKIFELMRKYVPVFERFITFLERKAEKNSDLVKKYERLGLFILVAIPLPGTGAWTGALVASLLELKFKDSLLTIFYGVLAAGVIVTLVTSGVVFFIR